MPSYTYDAGTTTPYLAGLAEYNGLRLNDGTYKLTRLGGLLDSAPVRTTVSDLPNADGGFAGPSFKGSRTITLEGYIDVDLVAYLDPAADGLRAAFSIAAGLSTLLFNRLGFTATRYVTAMVVGPVMLDEPVDLEKAVPQRNFTIAMIAPDPTIHVTGGGTIE